MVSLTPGNILKCKNRRDHQAAVYNPDYDYSTTGRLWGDIFPGDDDDGRPYGGSSDDSCNWNDDGKSYMLNFGKYQGCYCR